MNREELHRAMHRGDRMFWCAQACSVANIAAVVPVLSAGRIAADLLAAACASGAVVTAGTAGLLWGGGGRKGRDRGEEPRPLRPHPAVGIHADHMFWTAQAASWASLAGLAHMATLLTLALAAIAVMTLVLATLNGSETENEVRRLVDEEIQRRAAQAQTSQPAVKPGEKEVLS